jgi:hypothetical protein
LTVVVAVIAARRNALLGTYGSASPKQNHTRLLRRSRLPGSATAQTPLQRVAPRRDHGTVGIRPFNDLLLQLPAKELRDFLESRHG